MKKSIISRLMLGLLIAVTGFAFTACSNDDEPSSQSKELDAAIERLYTESGDPNVVGFIFDDEIVYVAPAETPEFGKTILGYYLGADVTGNNFIRKFDEHNSIRVSPGEEGVFYNVSVNFNGYKPYSFKVAPMQWLLNENESIVRPPSQSAATIICLDCGAQSPWFRMTTENPYCGKCGSKHIRCKPRG